MIDVRKLNKFNRTIKKLARKFTKAIEFYPEMVNNTLNAAGIEIRNTIIEGIMNPPKTGKTYGNHQASAPGEYPASNSGKLIQSIDFDVNGMELEIGSGGLVYGEYLELGTSKMKARPFIAPSVEEHKEQLLDDLADSASEVLFDAIKSSIK